MDEVRAKQLFLLLPGQFAECFLEDDSGADCSGAGLEQPIGETVPEIISVVFNLFFREHVEQCRIEIFLLQFQGFIGNDVIGFAMVMVVEAERAVEDNLVDGITV